MNNKVAFRFIEEEDLFHPSREVSSLRYPAGLFQRGSNIINEI